MITKSIEFGKMMREEVFSAVRTELNSKESSGVTLVCKDGEPVWASSRVLTTWSPVVRQILPSLENATIFLPHFSAMTATKVMEMLSMKWDKEGETSLPALESTLARWRPKKSFLKRRRFVLFATFATRQWLMWRLT